MAAIANINTITDTSNAVPFPPLTADLDNTTPPSKRLRRQSAETQAQADGRAAWG